MKKNYIRKQDLAHEYFPDATPHVAVNHLMRWVVRCAPLMEELLGDGYSNKKRYFSPRQRDMIYDYLGEP